MKREVVWTWAAEVDAQQAFMRFEDSAGGGIAFVTLTDRLLELLRSFPFMAATWHKPVRRALIRRSHYSLFYVVEPQRLVVIALQDQRRDPEALKQDILKRLP